MGQLSDVRWREAELCVVDLETTGLDARRDEIISFATIPIAGGRARIHDARYRVVRPERMPGAETIRIHGLRSEDLERAPPLVEVIRELVEALRGRALVAHVAAVEVGFLEPALAAAGASLPEAVIDTAELAARLWSLQGRTAPERIGLTPLARELGLPVHRPHEADGDALTTAQVFLALATQLDAFEPQTIDSLATRPRRSGPWAAVRRGLRRIGS